MKKEEFIKRRGEAAYVKLCVQVIAWNVAHPEKRREIRKKYYKAHPDVVRHRIREIGTPGGKHYVKHQLYHKMGLSGEKERIRQRHSRYYRQYKCIIAPNSQIHHEWIPGTPDYRGVALVEADPHMHGIIDVIKILEGKITLLSEEEIKKGGDKIEQ